MPHNRAVALALAAVLASAGCAGPGGSGEPVVVTETVATVTGAPVQGGVGAPAEFAETPPVVPSATGGPTPAPSADVVDAELATVVAPISLPAGVAVAPVGDHGGVTAAGAWKTGVAWSTIKVPLAVAVARSDPQLLEWSASAITTSDNQAAESLWSALGGGQSAASTLMAVLAEGGDTVSQVPSVPIRAGYSIFGQTRWSLVDQARFAAGLPCLEGSARVVDLMAQISSDQRWGLGGIPGARFKGGWGPGDDGGYLVRQFGVVPGAGGDLAVAMAVEAPTFEAGAAALTTMADRLAPMMPGLTGGAC